MTWQKRWEQTFSWKIAKEEKQQSTMEPWLFRSYTDPTKLIMAFLPLYLFMIMTKK